MDLFPCGNFDCVLYRLICNIFHVTAFVTPLVTG